MTKGVIFPLLFFTVATAQIDRSKTGDEQIYNEFVERSAKIRAEALMAKKPEWSGTYSMAHFRFELAPNSGFTSARFTHTYDLWVNYGPIEEKDGALILKPVLNDRRFSDDVSSKYFIVNWGEKKFLIAEDKMILFIHAVNIGSDVFGMFGALYPVKEGGDEKQLSGKPNVPRQYAHFLLKNTIRGSVAEVFQSGDKATNGKLLTRVKLNIGRRDGVIDKLRFIVYGNDESFYAEADVETTTEDSSIAVIDPRYDYPKMPAKGWKVTTTLKDLN